MATKGTDRASGDLCPLTLANVACDANERCRMDDCAWWIDDGMHVDGFCAVKSMAGYEPPKRRDCSGMSVSGGRIIADDAS